MIGKLVCRVLGILRGWEPRGHSGEWVQADLPDIGSGNVAARLIRKCARCGKVQTLALSKTREPRTDNAS